MTHAAQNKLKLMVVDDESDNLDLLYRTFRRTFEVFKAESAFKALELLNEQAEMAIIISDQRMPKMNGTEFLSIAAERYPDTIRILLTGYTDVEDLVGAINAGKVFKYVTKPWNPDELHSIVNQAAETYRVLKQRTNELHRALRRESLFNTVTTAIRESLDYRNMLQTIVATLSETFGADAGVLSAVENKATANVTDYYLVPELFQYAPNTSDLLQSHLEDYASKTAEMLGAIAESRQIQVKSAASEHQAPHQLIVPLAYQQELLAVLTLYQFQSPNWTDEDLELLSGVAEQAALAISQARLYQRTQEQTQQMRAELAVARQIQSNLLRPVWPELESVSIQARCLPAREVGGDFFEVYIHPQGDVWLAVGDVSGKGVPAALFMASAISILRRDLSHESSPEPHEVMRRLNHSLLDNLVESNCFITLVLARFSPTQQQLTYANAGHIYPMVWSRSMLEHSSESPPEPTYLTVRGVPLGILPEWRAQSGTMKMTSGDTLLLASDGITEATIAQPIIPGQPAQPVMLRQDGLWQLIRQEKGALNLDAILACIQTHNEVQEDDQTILSLEVL